jgi:hypothetical protein
VKRLFLLCLAALALALPAAAVADTNKPSSGHGNFKELRQQLKDAVSACKNGPAADSQRRECRARLLSLLVTAKSRIEAFKAQIRARCADSAAGGNTAAGSSPSSSNSAARPVKKGCAHADQIVQRLEQLEAKIDKLIEKLRKRGSSASGPSKANSTSTDQQIAEIEAGLANLPNP